MEYFLGVKRKKIKLSKNKHHCKDLFHEVKFLHQDTFTEINFYKDTVLFIMLLKDPIIIRIKNKEAADSFEKYFKSMWKIAKK